MPITSSVPNLGDPRGLLCSSRWWTLEVPEQIDATTAEHQKLRALTAKKNLRAGLSGSVQLYLNDPTWKGEAVAVLARRGAELSSEDRGAELLVKLDL